MNRRQAIKQGSISALALASPTPFMTLLAHHKMNHDNTFETIIIGGSYSGLSAAMTLGRSLRKVLVIDSGLPCNRQTPHSHNFLTQDGATPHAIASLAKSQVLEYPTVTFLEDLALEGRKTDNLFYIRTQSGQEFSAPKLVFATGVKDIMPAIDGFSDCWGISVVHCPYCHGYEIRHKKTGIIANGEKALHLAPLARNLSNDLSIITSGKADFDAEQLANLHEHGIRIIEKEILAIEHKNGYMKQLVFKDDSKEAFDATYAAVPFTQHCDIPEILGCELNEQGYVQVDMMHKTNLEGVFACGDNTSRMRSVANAVATGNMVGAVINMELSNAEFEM